MGSVCPAGARMPGLGQHAPAAIVGHALRAIAQEPNAHAADVVHGRGPRMSRMVTGMAKNYILLDLTMRDRQPRCQATFLEVALLSCIRRLDRRVPTGRVCHSCLQAGASAGTVGHAAPAHTDGADHPTRAQCCHQHPAPACHRATPSDLETQPRPSLTSSCCSTVGETNCRTSSPPRVAISRTRVLLMNMYCALGVRKMVSTSGIRWRFMPASWNS